MAKANTINMNGVECAVTTIIDTMILAKPRCTEIMAKANTKNDVGSSRMIGTAHEPQGSPAAMV